MQAGPCKTFCVLVCLTLASFACSPGSSTQGPAASATVQDTVAVTDMPIPGTSGAPVVSELNQEEILNIVRASLAAFPWRLEQNVLVKQTGQTQTSLTVVQSSTRGYNQSLQTLGSETITIESILIDSLLYLKISGSPAETYGLVDAQWTEIPPDSPLARLADTSAIDPAKIAEIFAADFAAMSGQSRGEALLFALVGSEDVSGIFTNIYESSGAIFTYRWWIDRDGRFHKTLVDIPQATRTILMEYDPSISIQPPIP